MPPSRTRSPLAVTALITLLFALLPPATHAGEPASLGGRVFRADGRTARAGAVVSLFDHEGRRAAESAATGAEGSFFIERVDPGEYHLVVAADEGSFLAAKRVSLAQGANPPLALALEPNRTQHDEEPEPASPPPEAAPKSTGGGPLPSWAKWTIAGAIGVTALVLINQIGNDENPATAF